ncbi:uncharacterized protein LOC142620979 isoform X1 [Castanea sativa]|uniref:uncharacterized protein LOC142620979 isoform X1 n=1 Tax=Castanea sativa TaxID=21020 RepID=UPI003F6506B5
MVGEYVIVRRCSQCGLSGHNFSTCSKKNNNNTTTIASGNYNNNNTSISIGNYNNNNVSVATGNTNNAGRIKIFGVYFQSGDDHDLKKSVSIENRSSKNIENEIEIDAERKKGKRWTEQEHRLFLTGLKELRKGDWRGISQRFVKTRSPSQVASHAQKYFLRQAAIDKKKTSVFDLSLNEAELAPKNSPVSNTVKNVVEKAMDTASAYQYNVNRFPPVCMDVRPHAQIPFTLFGVPITAEFLQ